MCTDRPTTLSPFHRGEQEVQRRLGVRDGVELFARRAVRDHMPDQHRTFFGQLPFLMLGAVDRQGRPWASLIAGRPGFVSSPDARRLDVAARPLFGDPVLNDLREGMDVGVLGIEPATRRRNRAVGRLGGLDADGFSILIDQSFGNCPQYIQTRTVEVLPQVDRTDRHGPVIRSDRFDSRTVSLIEKSDTLFIATAFREDAGTASQGADVSHRGGKPGFVRVEDERSFIFPDFSGNNHYNTIGNILLNPKAGILFADFDTGDLVYMTGEAEIIWDGEEVSAFEGAQRLVRFRATEVVRAEQSLPMRFTFGDYSPMLAMTGDWEQAEHALSIRRRHAGYRSYQVEAVEKESDSISSFLLRPTDCGGVDPYQPGQFLPIRLRIPGHDKPVTRTYTLSDAPGKGYYRISVKREGKGAVVSAHLHEYAKKGFALEALSPRGGFTLDENSERPVVLISAGVGITPMIAMANRLVGAGGTGGNSRRVYFIHGARNGRDLAFGDHVRSLAAGAETFTLHIRFSRPDGSDRLGLTHDSEGHVDLDLLKSVLPFDDYDFYLCGPGAFMRAMVDGLTGLAVKRTRIKFESFGPSTVKQPPLPEAAAPTVKLGADKPVMVKFSASGRDAVWEPGSGTLLELAESQGINPEFGCRSGSCGTCATRMLSGNVDYLVQPSAANEAGDVLICCAVPAFGGSGEGVALDL